MSSAGCNALNACCQSHAVSHWSRCQSLPGPDGPISPRQAGAALQRPLSCGACTHALVGSSIPHCVVDGVQIRVIQRPQRWRNEKIYVRRGKNCFWNTNILDFQISQSSVATYLRWGGSLYNRSIKISAESHSERIVKIGVHLPKLCLKNKVAVFGTRCRYAEYAN